MTRTDSIARIRIELNGIDPTIWRSVEVPLTTSLKGLHDVIQAVMPFENRYLFLFNVGDRRYGIPDREWDHVHETLDAKNIKLGALVERGVSAFSYTYDFGDDWRHSVRIENVTAADPTLDYPRFVDGSRRAPPEDVGGIPGFDEFLDAITKPRHPDHQRLTEWYSGSFDRKDARQLHPQEALSLSHRDAPLQQEGSNLIDDASAARISAPNVSFKTALSPNAFGMILRRRRSSTNRRSSKFVVRMARRCVTGNRRWAMQASKSAMKHATASLDP